MFCFIIWLMLAVLFVLKRSHSVAFNVVLKEQKIILRLNSTKFVVVAGNGNSIFLTVKNYSKEEENMYQQKMFSYWYFPSINL